jgi:hypothetical protein
MVCGGFPQNPPRVAATRNIATADTISAAAPEGARPGRCRAGAFAAFGSYNDVHVRGLCQGRIVPFIFWVILLASLQTTPGAPAPAAPAGDPWEGRWSITESTPNGQRMIVRRNTTAAALIGDRSFAVRVRVVVPLPRGADATAATDLHGVEDLLVDALERDRKAIGVLVITTDATREFVFYTADAGWAERTISDLRARAKPYELQTYAEPDPTWAIYASFSP